MYCFQLCEVWDRGIGNLQKNWYPACERSKLALHVTNRSFRFQVSGFGLLPAFPFKDIDMKYL